MEWFKRHADTLVILGSFALCFWNMNEKFNEKFSALDKDIAIIKTVLIMQKIMPAELAVNENKEK